MEIPEHLLDKTISVFFKNGKKDQGIVRRAYTHEKGDYVLDILVSSVAFKKRDVIEVGDNYVSLNFKGHPSSPKA